jgi:hypothetical protein
MGTGEGRDPRQQKERVARDQRAAGARHLTNEREQKLSDLQVERRLAYLQGSSREVRPR